MAFVQDLHRAVGCVRQVTLVHPGVQHQFLRLWVNSWAGRDLCKHIIVAVTPLPLLKVLECVYHALQGTVALIPELFFLPYVPQAHIGSLWVQHQLRVHLQTFKLLFKTLYRAVVAQRGLFLS